VEWRWDCGLKLDYDGPIVRVASRFYLPHKRSAAYPKYSGTITLTVGEYKIDGSNSITEKKLEADSLDELVEKTEAIVFRIMETTKKLLFDNKNRFGWMSE